MLNSAKAETQQENVIINVNNGLEEERSCTSRDNLDAEKHPSKSKFDKNTESCVDGKNMLIVDDRKGTNSGQHLDKDAQNETSNSENAEKAKPLEECGQDASPGKQSEKATSNNCSSGSDCGLCFDTFKNIIKEEFGLYVSQKRAFRRNHAFMTLLFVMAGITVGVVSSAFQYLVDFAIDGLSQWRYKYKYLVFIVPPAAFLVALLFVRFYFFGASGSGIPAEMALLDISKEQDELDMNERKRIIREGLKKKKKLNNDNDNDKEKVFPPVFRQVLSARVCIGKFLLTPLVICAGASVGREGPTVQISGCIMYLSLMLGFRYSWHIRRSILKTGRSKHQYFKAAITAGGAAGISAAFNTPLGGVIFAIEEMGNSFDRAFDRIVLIVLILSSIVSISLNGSHFYFGKLFLTTNLPTVNQLATVAVISSIFGGLLGGFFSYSLYIVIKLQTRIRLFAKHPYVWCFSMSIVFAVIAFFSDNEILGSGYKIVVSQLKGNTTYCVSGYGNHTSDSVTSSTYGVAKMFGNIICYSTGIPGGIFSPSLSAGAGFGANLYCECIRHLYPNFDIGLATLIMMQSYFSAVTQSPLSSYAILQGTIQIVFVDGVNDSLYVALQVALLLSALFSTWISRLINRGPLYSLLADMGLPSVPEECLSPELQELKTNSNIRLVNHNAPNMLVQESWYDPHTI